MVSGGRGCRNGCHSVGGNGGMSLSCDDLLAIPTTATPRTEMAIHINMIDMAIHIKCTERTSTAYIVLEQHLQTAEFKRGF